MNKVSRYIKFALIITILAVLILAPTSPALASANNNQQNRHWDTVWVYAGLEWKNVGSLGCWSIDGNPFGYVEHWRYYGGWSWDENYNGYIVPVYGLFDGYQYPDLNAQRDRVGPAQIIQQQDYYKCWSPD